MTQSLRVRRDSRRMMRFNAAPGTRIGGVDASGEVHEELVFDEDGLLEVPDDMQEYAQSLANALEVGVITRLEAKPRRS